MATTTVKISTAANKKLDTLQAHLRIRAGKRLTKQTILEQLIDRALEDEEPLILLTPPKYPLSERVRRKLRDYPVYWGVQTREEDIDSILYEGRE